MAAPLGSMGLSERRNDRSVRFMPLQDDELTKPKDQSKKKKIFSKLSRQTVHFLVVAVKILMLLLVLTALVASKVSIVTMLANLRSMTNSSFFENKSSTVPAVKDQRKTAAGLYWQLLFILMVPNVITWIRALFNGIIGKSSSQPWPTLVPILGGIGLAAVEAVSEIALLFYTWILLPPEISILLMNGLFSIQAILNLFKIFKHSICTPIASYANIDKVTPWWILKDEGYCRYLIVIIISVGLLMQCAGLTLSNVFVGLAGVQPGVYITIIVCTLLLSLAWSDRIQRLTNIPNFNGLGKKFREYADKHNYEPTARWKSNFISTSVRMILYPFVSYLIFRYTYKIRAKSGDNSVDPWCLNDDDVTIDEVFQWEPQEIEMFAIHIACSLLAYLFSWLACFMSLHKYGLMLPVMLATPVSLGVLLLMTNLKADVGFQMVGLFTINSSGMTVNSAPRAQHYWIVVFSFAALLWIGQIAITTHRLWKTKNTILATDEDMFVRPYYNSILLEQYLILNRDVTMRHDRSKNNGSTVFICSTMYREDVIEMTQMLRSLRRVAKHYKSERSSVANAQELERITKFESHIFFDGGCKGSEILPFAVQLLSLIRETLGVKLDQAVRRQTPYGCRLEWMIEPNDDKTEGMPFCVHLKDNQKVKNKKRWSQVMYMNYVINYRAKRDNLDLDSTFILTTDADIDFKAESAIVLLDMLARDFHVGAVSARTHPKGYGPLYWYQVFDYAIGHWLQKPAEHIFGCVLCCPGCFSLFRCSALKDCLETYSEEVTNAFDFLTKDMGEDRWLCTLLVENGWRLDYCAISNDETYSPVEFDEFFKQRRRWIPSTVANLWLLISSAKKITRRNTSINILFIIYQVFIILSTIIAPATVILITSSGIQALGCVNQNAVIITLLVIGVLYGLVCVFTSERTQLDLAKIMTILFSIVMVVVVVGIIKGVVDDIEHLFNSTDERIVCGEPVHNSEGGIPVSASTIYIVYFGVCFTVTAILHYREFLSLAHIVWYLLGLPGGYLILLIYSAANLNSRSWGTREVKSDKDKDIFTIVYSTVKNAITACLQRRTQSEASEDKEVAEDEDDDEEQEEDDLEKSESKVDTTAKSRFSMALEPADVTPRQHDWLHHWLQFKCKNCLQFYDNFVKEGYTEEVYVADMTRADLKRIGVKPEGFVRHLEKCIKRLVSSPIDSGIPESVESWIIGLNMHEEEENYVQKFEAAGYGTPKDVEHLNEITEDELKTDIGVTKPAHRKRFMQAIRALRTESKDEKRMRKAKAVLKENRQAEPLETDECKFWTEKVETTLGPIPEGLTKTVELKDSLKNLRNVTLIAILLINLIWIILFLTLTFQGLENFNIDPKLLTLVFLGIYGMVMLIQFVTMLLHRLITLSHYIARLNEDLPVEENDWWDQTNTIGQSLRGLIRSVPV